MKSITYHRRGRQETLDSREHHAVFAVGNLIFVLLGKKGQDATTVARPRVWAGHRLHAGDDQQCRIGRDAVMEPLAFGRPPATPGIVEGTTGLCREFWMRKERGPFRPKSLGSQDVELLGEGEL